MKLGFLFAFLPYLLSSQTISGTFQGDRIKNFYLTEKYISVDGFGNKKTVQVEGKDKFGLKFYSDYHSYWLTAEQGNVYLNIDWTKCTYCKPYKFQVKRIKKFKST